MFDIQIYWAVQRGRLLPSSLGNQTLIPMAENTTHYKSDHLKFTHLEGQKLSVFLQLWGYVNPLLPFLKPRMRVAQKQSL